MSARHTERQMASIMATSPLRYALCALPRWPDEVHRRDLLRPGRARPPTAWALGRAPTRRPAAPRSAPCARTGLRGSAGAPPLASSYAGRACPPGSRSECALAAASMTASTASTPSARMSSSSRSAEHFSSPVLTVRQARGRHPARPLPVPKLGLVGGVVELRERDAEPVRPVSRRECPRVGDAAHRDDVGALGGEIPSVALRQGA
jgi:hypothetical protein